MLIQHLITALFWLSTFTLLFGLWRRAQLWRAGKAVAWSWSQLLTIPKRYFVDLHHVVAREPYIARTHVATAGGAVAALVLVALNYGLMLYSTALNWAIVAATGIMFVGAFFVWLRRRNKISRLSRGAWSRLPYSLLAFALGLFLLTLPMQILSAGIAIIALLLLLAGSAELALGIGLGGPMKHAVAGLLHLAFHAIHHGDRLPERIDHVTTRLRPDFAVFIDGRLRSVPGHRRAVACQVDEAAKASVLRVEPWHLIAPPGQPSAIRISPAGDTGVREGAVPAG